jgi:iron-sulfur cluster repair protein YtfE (RIC family)
MIITDAFLGEHAIFYAQFRLLDDTLPESIDIGLVVAQAALLGEALSSHANLEEELLFQELERKIGPAGPLAVMRTEHQQIETRLAGLADSITLDQAIDLFSRTIKLARAHFAKEEQILYPLAIQTLDIQELNRLGHTWSALRYVFVTSNIASSL